MLKNKWNWKKFLLLLLIFFSFISFLSKIIDIDALSPIAFVNSQFLFLSLYFSHRAVNNFLFFSFQVISSGEHHSGRDWLYMEWLSTIMCMLDLSAEKEEETFDWVKLRSRFDAICDIEKFYLSLFLTSLLLVFVDIKELWWWQLEIKKWVSEWNVKGSVLMDC